MNTEKAKLDHLFERVRHKYNGESRREFFDAVFEYMSFVQESNLYLKCDSNLGQLAEKRKTIENGSLRALAEVTKSHVSTIFEHYEDQEVSVTTKMDLDFLHTFQETPNFTFDESETVLGAASTVVGVLTDIQDEECPGALRKSVAILRHELRQYWDQFEKEPCGEPLQTLWLFYSKGSFDPTRHAIDCPTNEEHLPLEVELQKLGTSDGLGDEPHILFAREKFNMEDYFDYVNRLHFFFNGVSADMEFSDTISLIGRTATFDSDTAILTISGDLEVCFPPTKNESCLLKILFERPVGEYVSWDELYEGMFGEEPVDGDKNCRTIQDTVYRCRKRVCKDLNTEDFFLEWSEKSIKRII